MKREELEEMTKAELIEHAEVQGVKVSPLDNKGTMVDKILGEYAEPVEAKKKPLVKGDGLPPAKTTKIHDLQGNPVDAPLWNLTIFSRENDTSDVDLIVNGYNIRVKRNVEVQVPFPYIEALRNSTIITSYYDPETNRTTPQQVMVYPHQASPA